MPERFLVLRGSFDGPLYLDEDGDWTADRDGARRFADRSEVELTRVTIAVHDGITLAVVPDRC